MFHRFQDGKFAVRTPTKFNRLPPDQVIKQTINCSQKGPAGIISSSTWVLSSHNTATLIADFKRGIELDYRKGSKDLNPKRILDDESAVIKCCDSINNWKNPFEGSDSLFCLSYGIVACHEEEMFNAESTGRRRLESFFCRDDRDKPH